MKITGDRCRGSLIKTRRQDPERMNDLKTCVWFHFCGYPARLLTEKKNIWARDFCVVKLAKIHVGTNDLLNKRWVMGRVYVGYTVLTY